MKSSLKRTMSAPELCASARAARARSRFPAMSPTTGLSWASAIFMDADMARCLAPNCGSQKSFARLRLSDERDSVRIRPVDERQSRLFDQQRGFQRQARFLGPDQGVFPRFDRGGEGCHRLAQGIVQFQGTQPAPGGVAQRAGEEI